MFQTSWIFPYVSYQQIKKLMKIDEGFDNEFDPWHFRNSILKKIVKASQKKGYNFFISLANLQILCLKI